MFEIANKLSLDLELPNDIYGDLLFRMGNLPKDPKRQWATLKAAGQDAA